MHFNVSGTCLVAVFTWFITHKTTSCASFTRTFKKILAPLLTQSMTKQWIGLVRQARKSPAMASLTLTLPLLWDIPPQPCGTGTGLLPQIFVCDHAHKAFLKARRLCLTPSASSMKHNRVWTDLKGSKMGFNISDSQTFAVYLRRLSRLCHYTRSPHPSAARTSNFIWGLWK